MFARLHAGVRALSRQPLALLFFAVLFVASQASITLVLEPVGTGHLLRMQTTLSAAEFSVLAEDLYRRGADGAFLGHFYYDWLHPLWYGGLIVLLMARGFERHRWPPARDGLLWLPVLAGLADLVENALHFYMIVDTAHITQGRVLVANGAAWLKWSLVAAGVTIAATLLLRRPAPR